MRKFKKHFIARWYYYATPLFILLDYFGKINVRVTALQSMPLYKNIYYGFCIFCGVLIFILPRCSPFVALIESGINFLMMLLLLFMPYVLCIMHDDIFGEGWQNMEKFNLKHVVNILIAGCVAVFAFRASLHRAEADFAPTEEPANTD
ncbi:MAG: hypothetical protein GWN67_25385 [Phycisphaerae bacterium]|nr:hypothetical protein [Phycisphaerae bacterium]NIP55464.1 hypothetical protein [Phycisphaerae bacterium]NIS54169.1 hypothetical protein [Phycisphaerae bacterium]NIU11773.1 hypothetical protein [Phycisphaerae bacterium]NIU59596.1 hypothetical protein [Phycisphaerae bacterium]